MRVLIVGAAGLIGEHLARRLGAQPGLQLRLVDRRLPVSPAGTAAQVECRAGDIQDEAFVRTALNGVDEVFHFAALLAAECEADLERGQTVNIAGLMQVLRLCAELPRPPRFLFASSVAAFGGALPDTVGDDVPRTPRTSYSAHKAIAELLIDDHTRRGLVDGRVLRLPIVLARNEPPSTAVSDRVATLVREPLLGRDLACGLRADTRMAVASAQRVAAAFEQLARVEPARLPAFRAMNLPSLSVTAAELAAAAEQAPVRRRGRVTWAPDPALQALVDGWPMRFASVAAEGLGLGSAETAASIVADFVAEHGLG